MTSIALLMWLLSQSAEAPRVAQRQVEALEQRWLASENDPAALDDILADDFLHVVPQGIVTKNEQLSFMRAHPAPASGRPAERHFENLRVRVYGTAGVATGVVVATMPDGKVRKTGFTDVFAYRQGRWQAVNAQETPLEK